MAVPAAGCHNWLHARCDRLHVEGSGNASLAGWHLKRAAPLAVEFEPPGAVRTKTMVPQHNKFVLFDSVPCTCGMVCGLVFALLCVKRTLPDRVQLVGPLSVKSQELETVA